VAAYFVGAVCFSIPIPTYAGYGSTEE